MMTYVMNLQVPKFSFSSGFKSEFSVHWNLINITLYTVLTNFSFYVYCAGYQSVFPVTDISKYLYHKCLFRHTMLLVTGLYNLHTLRNKGNSVTTVCLVLTCTTHSRIYLLSFSCMFHAYVSLHSCRFGSGG
jgi:hypothetical protein